jgi:uncharacterized membrane-anchored protein
VNSLRIDRPAALHEKPAHMQLPRLLIAFAVLAAGFVRAADEKAATANAEAKQKSFKDELEANGVKLTSGPATVPLGKAAEMKLPKDYHFVGKDSLDKFYQLTQNVRGGNEVGVVLAPGYMLFFDYEEIGYVKDEDKDKLDADKLLKTMSDAQEEGNSERKSRGFSELKLKGWATAPHYDAKTNNLKWALNLASSRDGFQKIFINESIRLLGRGGVMNVTLVSGTDGFKTAEVDADKLLAGNYEYVAGQKYSEFKAGDKIAAYGLSALVLGGAGVMAAKMGLFAKLGVLLGKAWKVVVVALVAVGAAIKKLFNKLTGARPEEPQPPAA